MSKTTLVLVDDHPMFRKGLRQVIEEEGEFSILGEADNGAKALELIQEKKPELVITDLEMPKLDGVNLTRQIVKANLNCQIIILTMHKSEEMFNEAIESGVKGYVLKESAHREIVPCIESVLEGRRYMSPALSEVLLARSERSSRLKKAKPGLDALTPTERLVLKHISKDMTTKEVAVEMNISPHTVTNHRANICAKLEIQGSHSLLKFAFDNKGLLN